MRNNNSSNFLSKADVAELQYYYLQFLFDSRRHSSIGYEKFIENFLSSDVGGLSYDINTLLNKIKLISIIKDDAFDFLNQRELNTQIGNDFEGIFINSEDAQFFDNRCIISNLRIAFSHGLFNITRDGQYICINMTRGKDKTRKERQFNVLLTYNQLDAVYKAIYDNYSNAPIFETYLFDDISLSNETLNEDLEKITLKRYYPNKQNQLDLDMLMLMKDAYNHDVVSIIAQTAFDNFMKEQKDIRKVIEVDSANAQNNSELIELLEEHKKDYKRASKFNFSITGIENGENLEEEFNNEVLYELSEDQKRLLITMLKETDPADRKIKLDEYIKKVLPVATTKIDVFERSSGTNRGHFYSLCYGDEDKITNIIVFCEYVLENLADLENNDQLRHYRNALVHGRYFLNYNDVVQPDLLEIKFFWFDSNKKGIKNENDFQWGEPIKIWDLYKLSCNILADYIEKNNEHKTK